MLPQIQLKSFYLIFDQQKILVIFKKYINNINKMGQDQSKNEGKQQKIDEKNQLQNDNQLNIQKLNDQLQPPFNRQQLIINAYKPLSDDISKYLILDKITIYFREEEENLRLNAKKFGIIPTSLKTLFLYLENINQQSQQFKYLCEQIKYLPKGIQTMRLDLSCQFTKVEIKLSQNLQQLIKNLPKTLSNLYLNLTKVNCSDQSLSKNLLESLQFLPKNINLLQFIAIDCQINEDLLMKFCSNLREHFGELYNLQELNLFFNNNTIRKASNKQVLAECLKQIPDQVLSLQLQFQVNDISFEEALQIMESLKFINPNLFHFKFEIYPLYNQNKNITQHQKLSQEDLNLREGAIQLLIKFIEKCNLNNLQNGYFQMRDINIYLNEGSIEWFWKGLGLSCDLLFQNNPHFLDLFINSRFRFSQIQGEVLQNIQKKKKEILMHAISYNKIISAPLQKANPGAQIKLNFWDLYM
ncbi:hypothetical protein TTHERM_00890090 (macronuclear) [Tetrahymena thermophila SB210]|uniref:Kinase domain protein n=1 Tax=Tetrahymena thermophila (strain SB210) TaxID=312017 RepID=Q23U89_TETTS|nr:hypothetical protein TTHERM_00890090 [Tetrahymena thermophila SB210]EAS00055.2 hypothetical protein TTHERM_00890090 [Tetrahymena thermophila SB210]|eukprot:XP_001020300.2 hypothetical protein TTHERM_00890090 [Tetrahymena thermophila SB210]